MKRGKCTHKRNIGARSHNRCCRGKAVVISYCVRLSVTLITQLGIRMRHFILSSVAYLAVPYLATFYLMNGVISWGNEYIYIYIYIYIEHKMSVLLTVHLSIILDNDQLDTQMLYFTISLL